MYIPTWILVGIVIVLFCLFVGRFSKASKKKEQKKSNNDWRSQMADHVIKWKKVTGRDFPSYEEMLELSEGYFNTFLFVRTKIPEEREKLLKEMREHEARHPSFAEPPDEIAVMPNQELADAFSSHDPKIIGETISRKVFSQREGEETVQILTNLYELSEELGYSDDGDPMKKVNPINMMIWTKAGQDYGERRKKSENKMK